MNEPEHVEKPMNEVVSQMVAMYHREFGGTDSPEPEFTFIETTTGTDQDFTNVTVNPVTSTTFMQNAQEWLDRLANEMVNGMGFRPHDRQGDFAASSPLRDENDEHDNLGADYDPNVPGVAESWFRKLRDGGE